jgi:hypothetical protein
MRALIWSNSADVSNFVPAVILIQIAVYVLVHEIIVSYALDFVTHQTLE